MEPNSFLVFSSAAIGLLILFFELFLPSGMLAVVAICCFVVSGYCAYQTWYLAGHLTWWWSYVGSMVVLVPSLIGLGVYWLPRTRWGANVFAMPMEAEDVIPFQDEEARLTTLINQRGIALSMFSPGGMAQVGREKFHAESEGLLIDAGEEIVVVGVRSNRLVVRKAALYDRAVESLNPESGQISPAAPSSPPKPTSETLDFDLPG